MKMLIDKLKLQLLLEKKREFINKSVDGIDAFFAGIFFLISFLCSDYHDLGIIHADVVATVAFMIGVLYLVYGIYKMIYSLTHKYNHNILYHDIENIDEITHKFSLVAIKDTFNDYANRFLLYYEKSWNCWFFFNYKTVDYANEENITVRLSNALHIPKDKISLRYVTARIQPKHSVKDDIDKVYLHSLYVAGISDFTEAITQDEFEMDGIVYRWMTIAQMEASPEIMSINSDVVAMVKERIS